MPRRLLVLGSTGSIGTQALDVVERSRDLELVGLSAASSWEPLIKQARRHGVTRVATGALERITITASGGPFRGRRAADLADVTVEEALAHPTWSMGGKITIDSATLMNKGLEVMEAHHLFGVPYDRIDVVVHPQSIVHALVQLCDGASLAHLGNPDMRVPISYALHHPQP